MAKKLGLKRIFYGRPTTGAVQKMSQEQANWLAAQLAADFAALPTEFRHPSAQLISHSSERVLD